MNKKALIAKLLKKNLVNPCIDCEACGGEVTFKPILQSNKITLTVR